ncbi:MAG: Ger(x)C family spore germination protein [Clostridiaceae bacterium]|nr:Ger(x)C family spore germination protein [Clostridiaceae bacterium]
MKKKFIFIIVLILSIISLTGCWDSIELNQREIVTAIGIDKGDEKGNIIVTFQSIIPERASTPLRPASEKSNIHVVSVTAKSITDSLVKYNKRTSKTPEYQHNRIYVIGEDLAREGVNSFIDGIFRTYEFRSRGWILVCKGKASDILHKKVEATSISADYIVNLITISNHVATVPTETLHTFLMKLSSKTTSPVVTQIEIEDPKEGNASDIGYNGCGVFKKDKLVGWLNMNETRGLLWITNEIGKGVLLSGYPGTASENISEQIVRSKVKINPKMINGKIMISLDIWEEGEIRENDKGVDINSPESIKALEDGFAAEIKKEVKESLQKIQKEYKTDIVGFGSKIHKKFPSEWKNIEPKWDEVFPEIEVEVNVEVKLSSTGKIINSITP